MRAAEVLASRILFWGGILSVVFLALGIVGYAARGGLKPESVAAWQRAERGSEAHPPDVFVSVGQVTRALARWPVEPLAIVAAGILLLLVTPLASVLAVLVVFLSAGDRRYAAVAAVLVGALLVSVLFVGRPR